MVRIFAKLNTKEKAVVNVLFQDTKLAMKFLNEKFGGQWLPVDDVNRFDVIPFQDSEKYKGFEIDKKEYTGSKMNIADEKMGSQT